MSGRRQSAASGGYTAIWVLLSHSGTFEERAEPLLRSGAAAANDTGIPFKCYNPPGYKLTSVLSNTISENSTVTNFGMTLTVAHHAACKGGNRKLMFNKIITDLKQLDTLAPYVKYEEGGQIITDPIEDKTIFMRPMKTDSYGIHPVTKMHTGRDSRTAAGLRELFPGLGLYLIEVYHTDTGDLVDNSLLDPLLVNYILGRRCNIHKITKLAVESNPRPGIPPTLFDTLEMNGLPQYYLDANIESETPSAKNYVSDFEIFRGENSRDIQQIMSKNYSVMDEDEYDSVMYHYAAAVKTKCISLFDLKKVCKLLSPPGTTACQLFDIGCRDPYPKPPIGGFTVTPATWPQYDDQVGSATSLHSFEDPLSPPGSPVAYIRPPRFIGPREPYRRMSLRSSTPSLGTELVGIAKAKPKKGGKPRKTRRDRRNKSRNFRNKSISRRTRRRVIKRKNN